MEDLLEDLGEREKEINEYFALLEFVDDQLLSNDSGDSFKVSSLLIKTLKGAVFLLLYNLIESTMREAVASIHDSIDSSGEGYEKLRRELKRELWVRARKNSISYDDLVADTEAQISSSFHLATFSKKNLFSGNITRDEIKNISRIYGFSERTDHAKTASGEKLEEVKVNRNDLAHGNKTFSEVGAGNTISDLKNLSDKVINYIYEIVDNIMDCVDNQLYK